MAAQFTQMQVPSRLLARLVFLSALLVVGMSLSVGSCTFSGTKALTASGNGGGLSVINNTPLTLTSSSFSNTQRFVFFSRRNRELHCSLQWQQWWSAVHQCDVSNTNDLCLLVLIVNCERSWRRDVSHWKLQRYASLRSLAFYT